MFTFDSGPNGEKIGEKIRPETDTSRGLPVTMGPVTGRKRASDGPTMMGYS